MNKEEALEKLERYLECQSNDCNLECDNCELFEGLLDEHEEAIRVVIQELKKLSIKETPKKIKKQAYMETTCDCGHVFSKHHGDGYYSIPYDCHLYLSDIAIENYRNTGCKVKILFD